MGLIIIITVNDFLKSEKNKLSFNKLFTFPVWKLCFIRSAYIGMSQLLIGQSM